MDIEFDPEKERKNLDKHGISLSLAHEIDWAEAWVENRIRDLNMARPAFGPVGISGDGCTFLSLPCGWASSVQSVYAVPTSGRFRIMSIIDKPKKIRHKGLNLSPVRKSASTRIDQSWEDNPELDDDWFKRARPAAEILPRLIGQEATDRLMARSRGMRGPQKSPKKVPISIRLDSDVIDHYRALGTGWQAQMNADLRQNLNGLSDTPQAEFAPGPKSKTRATPKTPATPPVKKTATKLIKEPTALQMKKPKSPTKKRPATLQKPASVPKKPKK